MPVFIELLLAYQEEVYVTQGRVSVHNIFHTYTQSD